MEEEGDICFPLKPSNHARVAHWEAYVISGRHGFNGTGSWETSGWLRSLKVMSWPSGKMVSFADGSHEDAAEKEEEERESRKRSGF